MCVNDDFNNDNLTHFIRQIFYFIVFFFFLISSSVSKLFLIIQISFTHFDEKKNCIDKHIYI